MEHKLFTREIIADFIETRLKRRLSSAFIIDRNELFERFDCYVRDNKLIGLRMYSYSDDYDGMFDFYYDRQAELLSALIEYSKLREYSDLSYISQHCIEGYYKLKFCADPLNLTEWEKFISCIRGENKHIQQRSNSGGAVMSEKFTQGNAKEMYELLHKVLKGMNDANRAFREGYYVDDMYEGITLIDDDLCRDDIEALLKRIDGEQEV